MATLAEDGLTLCYEEAPSSFDVSVSQMRSKASCPSFSQAAEARIGLNAPGGVRFSWSEPHYRKRRLNRGRGDLVFARVSVSNVLRSWPGGAFGEFVKEVNRRVNHVLRSVALGHVQIV